MELHGLLRLLHIGVDADFALTDLRKACTALGMKSPQKSIIFRWTENGLIEKQGDLFVKLTK